MTEPRNLLDLPADLRVPVADGACVHLPGMPLPALALPDTDGGMVDLSMVPGRSIETAFYPVFPPDADAANVAAWLREH